MATRLDTGIDPLDKKLNGGIPPGAIVTCTTDSRTQAELLLHRMMSNHSTLYITTIGNEETIQAEFAKSPVNTGDVDIMYASPDSTLQQVKDGVADNDSQLIILDAVNLFEDSNITARGSYQAFLNWLQNMLRQTGGVIVFHRYHTENEPDHSYITNSMSDIILELEEQIDGADIVNYLHMPKCRGAGAIDERLKVSLKNGLSIDTSRDIA